MRPLAGCLLVGVPLLLLPSPPLQACSCPSSYAVPLWPPAGATGVPLDAPFVVGAAELAEVQTQLAAEDGTPVALVERGRLDLGSPSCVNARYLFVAPAQPLATNRSYRFSASLPALEPNYPAASSSVSFVTGTSLRDPTPRDLPLHLFAAQYSDAQRLELFIEWDTSEPIFIGVHGEKANIAQSIFPGFAEQPADIHFGVVDCADFTLFDVTGQTIASPHLCKPSKCTATQSLGVSSCGGEDFSPLSWADWQSVPDGCGDRAEDVAPTLATDAAPIAEVARADTADASVEHGGCALQPIDQRRASPPLLLVGALALLGRAFQRRSRVGGSPLRDSTRH